MEKLQLNVFLEGLMKLANVISKKEEPLIE